MLPAPFIANMEKLRRLQLQAEEKLPGSGSSEVAVVLPWVTFTAAPFKEAAKACCTALHSLLCHFLLC
jgi:hypothetical protein